MIQVQWALCGTIFIRNIENLGVSCYNGNNEQAAWALFAKHPQAQVEWLYQNPCFTQVLTAPFDLSPRVLHKQCLHSPCHYPLMIPLKICLLYTIGQCPIMSLVLFSIICIISSSVGIILCMHPANEWRCYIVTSSLIGWAHMKNNPWFCSRIHCNKINLACYHLIWLISWLIGA